MRVRHTQRSVLLATCVTACLCTFTALAVAQSPPTHTTARGITGTLTLNHTGQTLRASLDQSLTAPLLVRVTDLTPSAPDTSEHRYRIDYIGAVAGTFDLRTLIVHHDGTSALELAPLEVQIASELPANFGTDLFGTPPAPNLVMSYYRLVLALIALLWIAIPIVLFVRRHLRKPPAPEPPPAKPSLTLADQLRPLIQAAMQRDLSIEDQARLELLLLAFWSERRALAHLAPALAIAQLRTDSEASPLLLAVEEWLHARGHSEPRPARDLMKLLEPYAAHAPIAVAQVARLAQAAPPAQVAR